MRRLTLSSALALLALAATAVTASAASAPVITSVSPKQVGIGGTLVITGKNFKKGVSKNRVFFSRASDGKTVRARPSKADSTRRLEVKVPAALDSFLTIKDGAAVPTRFKIQVLSAKFSKKTATSNSPLIYPAGSAPASPNSQGTTGTGTGTTGTGTTGSAAPSGSTPAGTTAPAPDCDADGTPDAADTDDDNDGLSDDLENAIHTNSCNKDTDGDGVEDGYEYWSARDLNGNAVPYAGKRPFPNALDPSDGSVDFDGDGLTQREEFQAWSLYGGRVLPSADGQTFPYSDGNQTSPAPPNAGGSDYDQNGSITDEEKDVDNDGLANWVEIGKGSMTDSVKQTFAMWKNPNGGSCGTVGGPRFQDCGAGTIPNGNTFVDGGYASYFKPNWLDPDSDGDGITDGADDQDHDDISNLAEIAAGNDPVNPCVPNTESRTCAQH